MGDHIFGKIKNKFLGSSSGRSKNVKKNIAGSLALKGVNIVVQLLLVPMTLGYLSEELYGVWLTVSSVVLWMSFFDVGFSLGLKNKLAEAVALGDTQLGKQLVSTTYIILILIFIPLGVVAEILAPMIDWSRFLNVSSELNMTLVNVIRVLIVSFVVQMILSTLSAIVAAYQKVALSNSFLVIGNVLSLLAIWCLTKYTEPSLLNMALAVSFVPSIVLAVCSLILFSGPMRDVRPSVRYFRRPLVRSIFSLGAKFFIIQMQIIVIQQSSNILISNLSGPDYVTYYNIAYRYMGSAMMVFTLILNPLWPAFTDAYVKRDYPWMNNIYKKLSRLCIGVMIVILGMCFLSPIAYHIWIGEKANIPWIMTLLLSIYFCAVSWDSLQVNLINGIGTIKLQSYITMVGMIVHIPLSLVLGKFIGAYGVVVSMTLITISYCIFFTLQLRRILQNEACGIWNA
jgi:O-antigen/teichoic acid export membrane protein